MPLLNHAYGRLLPESTEDIIGLQGSASRINASEKRPASTVELPFIPAGNSAAEPDSQCHLERRYSWIPRALSGWRGGLLVCIIVTAFVLVINLVFLIWAVVKVDIKDGLGVAYRGDSDTMDQLSRAIHLVVNVLGTLLLGASNYSIQIMLAPTRAEVDHAHRNRDWVDLGSQSLRNLKFISKGRALICFMLAISSIPLHLLYNSTIFPTIGANEYFALIVTEEFFVDDMKWDARLLDSNRTLDFWQNPDTNSTFQSAFGTLKREHSRNDLLKMTSHDCLKEYGVPFQNKQRSVFVVMSKVNQPMLSDAQAYHSMPFDATPHAWLCEKYSATRYGAFCNMDVDREGYEWPLLGSTVAYCLVEPGPLDLCRITFSLPLLLAVIAANVIKLAAMLVILFRYNQPTIVTLGDGIASFLERPDAETKGMCLWSKKNFRERAEWRQADRWSTVPKEYNPKLYPSSSGSAATKARWNVTVLLLVTMLGAAALFFVYAVRDLKHQNSMQDTTIPALWTLGFGTVKAQSIITKTMHASLPTLVILANLPQLALSAAYMLVNRLLSAMAAAREWSSFAHTRKGLRVTAPTGQQRSTFWLQLPYAFAVPQLALSALLHYFVSQSLFLAQIAVFDALGHEDARASVSTIGFSAIAVFCTLLTVSVALVATVAAGLLVRCEKGMVPVGFCSAAVAAACHPPAWEGAGVAVARVRWGDVDAVDGFYAGEDACGPVGHCGFSAGEVALPVTGKLYA